MSVKICCRGNCSNIMCDHHSVTYGYICTSCLSELKSKVGVDIGEFMNTNVKEDNDLPTEIWEHRVQKEFTLDEPWF